MLKFCEVTSEEALESFGKMKLELMKYHLSFAEKFGIADHNLLDYTEVQALSTANQRINFLFYQDHEPVGMSQIQEQISPVDHQPILFIYSIYIKPSLQNQGIGDSFLRYLCQKFRKRIECECWYDLPAKRFYEHTGFLPMVTRYILPTGSDYYGSDQNCISE